MSAATRLIFLITSAVILLSVESMGTTKTETSLKEKSNARKSTSQTNNVSDKEALEHELANMNLGTMVPANHFASVETPSFHRYNLRTAENILDMDLVPAGKAGPTLNYPSELHELNPLSKYTTLECAPGGMEIEFEGTTYGRMYLHKAIPYINGFTNFAFLKYPDYRKLRPLKQKSWLQAVSTWMDEHGLTKDRGLLQSAVNAIAFIEHRKQMVEELNQKKPKLQKSKRNQEILALPEVPYQFHEQHQNQESLEHKLLEQKEQQHQGYAKQTKQYQQKEAKQNRQQEQLQQPQLPFMGQHNMPHNSAQPHSYQQPIQLQHFQQQLQQQQLQQQQLQQQQLQQRFPQAQFQPAHTALAHGHQYPQQGSQYPQQGLQYPQQRAQYPPQPYPPAPVQPGFGQNSGHAPMYSSQYYPAPSYGKGPVQPFQGPYGGPSSAQFTGGSSSQYSAVPPTQYSAGPSAHYPAGPSAQYPTGPSAHYPAGPSAHYPGGSSSHYMSNVHPSQPHYTESEYTSSE